MQRETNAVLEAIKKRRTIRNYLPNAVPDRAVDIVLDAAHWSPSAANRQPWRFIVVKNVDAKKKIQNLVEENRTLTIKVQAEPFKTGFSNYRTDWISSAPVHLVVCADPSKTGPHAGGEETYKYATGAAIQNLMLAAYSLDLGTCWLSMFNKNDVKALLEIPEEIDVIGIVTLGYPKEIPEAPNTIKRYGGKPRCDLSKIVFWEKFGNASKQQTSKSNL